MAPALDYTDNGTDRKSRNRPTSFKTFMCGKGGIWKQQGNRAGKNWSHQGKMELAPDLILIPGRTPNGKEM